MRRAVGFLVAVGLVAAGACSNEHEQRRAERHEAAVDRFCAAFGDYLGARELIREAAVGDPRRLMAPVAAIEPPVALSAAWRAWEERERLTIAADTVWAGHGGGRFWLEPVPEPPENSEVDEFWEQDCVEGRDYEVTQLASETDPELPPYDQAPDGHGVRVVEVGSTQTPEPPPFLGSGRYGYTYGVVVENTSAFVALRTLVEVWIAGDKHRHTIPILMPGQQFGLGGEIDVEQEGVGAPEATAGGTEYWWPAEHEAIEFALVTPRDVTTLVHSDETLEVRFTFDSGYPVTIGNQEPGLWYGTYQTPYVVFRNAAGEIIGGGNSGVGTNIPPGRSFGEMGANQILVLQPGGIDHTRTRVYF